MWRFWIPMIQKCLWSHWIILGWALNCLKNPRGERVQVCVLMLSFLFTSGWFVCYFNTYEQLLHHMWTTFTDYILTFSSLKQEVLGKNINNTFLWWSHLYLENCCHCCFPQLEGLTNHNTESFALYYWGKESSLSSVLYCINITGDAIYGGGGKGKEFWLFREHIIYLVWIWINFHLNI